MCNRYAKTCSYSRNDGHASMMASGDIYMLLQGDLLPSVHAAQTNRMTHRCQFEEQGALEGRVGQPGARKQGRKEGRKK